MVIASDKAYDMHLVGAASGATGLPRYRYTPEGERFDNITDWGLKQFRSHYKRAKPQISKDDISIMSMAYFMIRSTGKSTH